RGVQAQRVGEDRVADAGVRGGAVTDRVDVAEAAGADLEQADGDERSKPDQERVPVLRDDPVVDRVLDDERRADRPDLPEQAGEDGADHTGPLLVHDCAQESPRRSAAHLAFPHEANGTGTTGAARAKRHVPGTVPGTCPKRTGPRLLCADTCGVRGWTGPGVCPPD